MAVRIRCLSEASSPDPISIHKGCSADSGRSLLSRSCLLLLILLEKSLDYFVYISSQLVSFLLMFLGRSLLCSWASLNSTVVLPARFVIISVDLFSFAKLLFLQIHLFNFKILISFIVSPLHACQCLQYRPFVESNLLFQKSFWFWRKTVCNLEESILVYGIRPRRSWIKVFHNYILILGLYFIFNWPFWILRIRFVNLIHNYLSLCCHSSIVGNSSYCILSFFFFIKKLLFDFS